MFAYRAIIGFMDSSQLADEMVALLGAIDVAALADAGEVERCAEAVSRVRCKVESLFAALAVRAGEVKADAQDLLRRAGRLSDREARRAMRRVSILREIPRLGLLLEAASISADHVDALARVAAGCDAASRTLLLADGATLADFALIMNPDAFERYLRGLVRRAVTDDGVADLDRQRAASKASSWTNPTTGMMHLSAEFDPETGARLMTVIEREIEALYHRLDNPPPLPQLMAQAIANLILGGHAATRPGVAEIIVITDAQTLVSGRHAATVSETSSGIPLPVDTIRRLCCESEISIATVGANGEVLNLRRERRLANRAQRRALRAMYRTCGLEGCETRFDHCQIHHVVPWEAGGFTDLANLLPLCNRHHRLVHEGKWRLTLTPDRQLTIVRPDGSVSHQTLERLAA